MSEKRKIPIAEATAVAESLLRLLTPDVERIVIAGSIRRRKPFVGDVELLFVPKVEMRKTGLFDNEPFDLTGQAIDNLVIAGVLGKRKREDGAEAGWGSKNRFAFHCATGIPVDLFATPSEHWFTSLVIRTGGAQTNKWLATGAIKQGCRLNAYGAGVTTGSGDVIAATSEEHVFKLCGLRYTPPHERF